MINKKIVKIFILLFILSTTLSAKNNIKLLLNKEYTSTLLRYLKKAEKEVIISSFMWCCYPDKYGSYPCRILDTIIHLIKKGVKVTIILEKDINSDSKCNNVTALIFKHTLLKKYKNLKLYFDSPLTRSHQKIILIDEKYCFLGSHNLTQSALKYNNEVSILIKSNSIYKKLKNYLNKIILSSEQIY